MNATPSPLDAFHLGYAGPRQLGPRGADPAPWEKQLAAALDRVAAGLRERLAPERPLCLVGALAQGADLAIAEALMARGALLRAWLPETLDRFSSEQDFPSEGDRARLARAAASPRTAEVRVVSRSPDRGERFAEAAARVVEEVDAMLCVRHWEAAGRRGGTEESVALAASLGRPVIEVRLNPDPQAQAEVLFPEDWAPLPGAAALPFTTPEPATAIARWKAEASAEARRGKLFIVRAAAWTVGLQLAATAFAVFTFNRPGWEVPSLLVKTVAIAAAAAIAVWALRRGAAWRWASHRFLAELHRAWNSVRGLPGGAPWLEEDLPPEFVRHGRDLSLLQGLDARLSSPRDAADFRDRYLRERLAAQKAYAGLASARARRRQVALTRVFHCCLALALLSLLAKLGLRAADAVDAWRGLDSACSLLSLLGPTFGAAAVSFVALLDLPAEAETHRRLAEFLGNEERRLATAQDWIAVRSAVESAERRLLAETKGWFARRAFRK